MKPLVLKTCLGPGCSKTIRPTLTGLCDECLVKDPRKLARVMTGQWSYGRNKNQQAQFRRALLARAAASNGGVPRCEFVAPNGMRCSATDELDAHHDTPTSGRLLCNPCHQREDRHARRRAQQKGSP